MEWFRPIIAIMATFVFNVVDGQNNVYFTRYSVRYRYEARQDGIYLTEAGSNATSSTTSNIITGSNLWNSELYASQNRDGSGVKRIIERQLLNREQSSRTLLPGGTLKFTNALNVNLHRLGSFPYLCLKLSKHPSARPNYQFLAGMNNYQLTCRSIPSGTQSPQTNNPSRNSVDFDNYYVRYEYQTRPATTSRPRSVSVRSVQIRAQAAPTSINFSGRNVWQAKLFVAEREDGVGPRIILSNQLLNPNQASTSVFPGKVLTFTANRRFNLDGYGPGTSFPYLCTEFTTNPAANVEFRFGTSRSAIYCGIITSGTTDLSGSQANINRYSAEISFSQTDPNSNMAVANIVYIVNFGDSSSSITGNALWQLRLFASQYADGTGVRRILSQQLLNRDQLSTGVEPGGQLRFEINPLFQVDGLGPGTNLPYLCLAFNKHPAAAIEVDYQGSEVLTSCEPIPDSIVQQTSRAVVRQSNADISFTRTDPSSTNVVADVNYDVTFDRSSDVIDGNSLWQLGMFASQNPDGTGPTRVISRQLLDENQVSAGVRPGGVLRFRTSDSFDFTGLGPGTNLQYICLTLEKHPSADFELVVGDRNAIIGCRALPQFTVQQTSRAVVRQSNADISFARTDPSSTNVITDVNFDVTFDRSSDVIDGNPLWQLGMFASQSPDGTGPTRVLSRQLLDENQVAAGVRPGGVLRFRTSDSFDFAGLGSGTNFPYICLSLEKHSAADFELVVGDRNAIIGCQAVPFSVTQQMSRAVVRQSNADISFARTDPTSTNVITDVNFDVTFDRSSDVINGNPLWQLGMFASQSPDGTGPTRVISRQLLDENQVAAGVRPGGVLRFRTSDSFDFTGIGPGTNLRYICLSLEKHPSADFELAVGDRNAIIGCRALPQSIVQQMSRAVVGRSNSYISFTRTDPSSTNVITDVIYDVTFDRSSDVINGNPLWQFGMFASQNPDGTGPTRVISRQLLDENQVAAGVRPGGVLRFRTSNSFDFTGLGPGTNLPYICLSLEKHPSADFELFDGDRNVIIGCRALPQSIVEQQTSRAVVRQSNADISFTRTDPTSSNVVTNINYDITFDRSSDVINGDPLWQLGMFASQNPDGTGPTRVISRQLLDENQVAAGVRPGGVLLFTTSDSFDFMGLGPETDLPFICLSLEKHPSADFELVVGDRNVIIGCRALPQFTVPQTSRAVVRQSNADISFARTDPSSTNVITDVNYDITFDRSSDVIDGNPLWQLGMFASQNSDGTGPTRVISRQLLDENQVAAGVRPGGVLLFRTSDSFDFMGLGPGTDLPFICLSLEKHPSADFELVVGDRNVIIGCRALPQFTVQQTSRAVVRQSNADISFARTDPSSTNVITDVNYDITFDRSSDVIDGNPLWQLGMFASQNSDGTGPTRVISRQLLDENQVAAGVRPGGVLLFRTSDSFDFMGLGPETDLPFICLSLEKHPSADFELVVGDRNVIIGCRALPQFTVQETSRAVVRQSNADISFARTDPSSTNVITDVNYDITFDRSSDAIDGNPLWQLGMFASQNSDGTGPTRVISRQLLDENQVAAGVRPGGVLRFRTSDSFDFMGLGPETDLPFICLSLEKHPSADFELVVGDRNVIIGCRALPQFTVQETSRAVVRQSNADISFARTDPSSTNVITDVNYDITFDRSSDAIDGNPLWQLGMFASQNSDGTGPTRVISRQLLDENQVAAGVRPGGVLRFRTSDSFDFMGLGPETDLPFICLSLEKHPSADFELVVGDRNVIIGCRALPQFTVQETSRAVVRQSNADISFVRTDPSSTNVITDVNYDITFDRSSDAIDGNPLWQLGMFASQNSDGTGPTRVISRQLLDEYQVAAGVRPGGMLRFRTSDSFDFIGLGPETDLPFICLSLEKHPSADFELVVGDRNVIIGCRALPQLLASDSKDESLPIQAIVNDQDTEMTFTSTDPSNNRAIVNITLDVRFDETSGEVDGNNLWQLILFASEFDDGTGGTQLISAQLLNQEQMALEVIPGGRLLIETTKSFDATNLGPDFSLPYICMVLSKHPTANFELVNKGSAQIVTCEPLPLFEASYSEETKTCRLWGDPHQKTFDGYGYSFQGEGEYVAVKTCKDDDGTLPEFRIIAENFRRRPSKPVTYLRELKLEYNGSIYSLIHPNTVLVDGVAVTVPFSDENGVKIHMAPPHKILKTNFGLVVRLDDAHDADITLPVRFSNKVCGICGNFDGIRGNECHYPDGTSMELRNEECKDNFTQQFIHNTTDTPPPYREHIKPLTSCGEGSALFAIADDQCSILTDPSGPLAACHPFVSPDFYYETCIFDLCQLLPSSYMLCESVEAYVLECSHFTGGTVEVGPWRDVTEECQLYCGEGKTFTYRGSACPPTCTNPDGTVEDCPFPFLETCQCEEGMVLDGERCVNVTECGCQMEDGRYLSIGEEFMRSDCSESCLCTEDGALQCMSVTCAVHSECAIKSGKRDCYCQEGFTGYGREECTEGVKSCRIYGDPHFYTFDQDFYSFQGDCAYTAVRTCKTLPRGVPPFQIRINNDALVPEERYTYVTVARLNFRGKLFRISYTGVVTVDNVNIVNSLPFRDESTGVEISKYKNSIILSTDGGIHLNFTSDNELTIKLPPVYFGKVCGLCGNADGNSTNDKQLPDGTLGKKLPFANSWSAGSCIPMDEPVESCVVGTEEEATAIDICSDLVRKDGPFANCHDFRDPTHFYESCVFDLCATLPSTELYCVSVNQYLQACVESGGSVKGDWKKAVEYCSSIDCPEGYTAFKNSCYRYYRAKKNYEQSKAFCRGRGGHLVTITSRAENDFITKLAEETDSWIGAERNHSASYTTYTSDGNDSYTFLPDRLPRGVGSIRFGVNAASSAYIILSPTRNPTEDTPLYEFAIGANRNKRSFFRRCMNCPEEDFRRKTPLKKGQERRFFINFHDGIIMLGRYKKRDLSLNYRDDDPIVVKYIGFKTVGPDGTWNFYDNEFMWVTNEPWTFDNYRFGEPSNYNNEEHCLETNYDSRPGNWNDHFCYRMKGFVCEVEGE
ncbi:IgGFc-binding protein [Holothuria leucospilota]|uniref:IgGFc-binding protein n=1 Tax=Holothuria leucospilota TaxID=206669 RepID=A0A9Q1HF62_HOLLE|nr:IgGFc-binding protein [Holothuria leucospilota]